MQSSRGLQLKGNGKQYRVRDYNGSRNEADVKVLVYLLQCVMPVDVVYRVSSSAMTIPLPHPPSQSALLTDHSDNK